MLTSLLAYHLVCDRFVLKQSQALFMSSGFHCVFRFFLWCYKQNSSWVTCHTSYSHFNFLIGKILSFPCSCVSSREDWSVLWWATPIHAASAPSHYPITLKEVSEEKETPAPWSTISESTGKPLWLNPSHRPVGQWKTFNAALIWLHCILYTHLNVFNWRTMRDSSLPSTLASTKHSSSPSQSWK